MDGKAVLLREREVALVVGGHGHDRAGAVLHEHVVGHPHRDRFAGDRVQHAAAGVEADLLQIGIGLAGRALVAHLLDLALEPRPFRMIGQKPLHQRVLRRQHDVGHAAQRVDAGGEALHLEGLAGADEAQGDAVAAADPVALHGAHALRPFIQAVQIVQERLRVVRGLEEPLRELLLLDGGSAPLARARPPPARWPAR